MGIAGQLAERIVALSWNDLTDEAIMWAKVGVLDTIGVTVAGAIEPATTIVARVAGAERIAGQSLVYGTSRRTDPMTAALINGTASHALDFDDCNNTFGGHPSAMILPALLALTDEHETSGRDALLAYIAGFETLTCIAKGVQFYHYEKGWHPTATLGVFGAAAASARILGLSVEQTETALAIASSFASGIKANIGTHTKPLHVGHGVRDGLFAALLAREGFTANPLAFEHPHGFFLVYNGEGNFDASKIIGKWGNPWDVVEPGIAIKQYPCCASPHPALDSMLAIVREHDVDPRRVARVDAFIHRRRLAHTNRPEPRSSLEGKFSLQYVLARALVSRKITFEHFEGDAIDEPLIRELLPKIHAAPYTQEQFAAENHFGGEVRVTLDDGSVLVAKADMPLGRTSKNPLPQALLREKFANCITRVMPGAPVDRIAEAIEHLEELRVVSDVSAMLAESAQEMVAT